MLWKIEWIKKWSFRKIRIIEKNTHTEWGSPIVPVVKKDGSIRLCADYKPTINKFLKDDNYPIPRIQDILAKMYGGKWFCTLDISEAYLHIAVDDESSFLQAISTESCSKYVTAFYGPNTYWFVSNSMFLWWHSNSR